MLRTEIPVDLSSITNIEPGSFLSKAIITVDAPCGEKPNCIDINVVQQPTGREYDAMEGGKWVKKPMTRVVAVPCEPTKPQA